MKKMALFAALVLTLVSCGNKSTKKLLPSVSGKAGEILVVMDKTPWEGEPGNAVRELLACDCPYLATREPLYSLVNVVPSNFVNLFQVHRNLVIYEIDPQVQQEGVQYLNDIWARPQCVVKVSATTDERAVEITKENGEVISEAIEQAERNRVIANTRLYEEASIFPQVAEVIGGSPHFPSGYKLKKKTTDFVWVGDEKLYVYQDVFVYKYPAKGDESDFTLENIIANRNRVLQQNVPGMLDNTYMTTGEFIPPTLRFVKYKNFNFAQVRGYWEVYNDFMGGPFVSHSFYSPDGKEIVVAEAFVYAPRYDKRQYLRQVESLLYSFEWKGTGE
ncbi:MAG: DUF4837 family protein [Bacteroidales bacterium]|nr:DUF4837 family protein [Bacteroidales bacterium]